MRWAGDTIAPSQRNDAGFGVRHVRSYVVGRGVTDTHTGVTQDVDRALDGDLDAFLRAALVGFRA